MANIWQRQSGSRLGCARKCRRKRCSKSVEAELAVQITSRAGVEFVKAGDSAKNPGGIYALTEQFQFFREQGIAQDRFFQFGRKFKEIGEQAVKYADLILEGGITVFGKSRGIREQLGKTMTLGGAFEDAECVSPALGRGVDIHFNSQARAAFRNLRGELDFGGFASGFFFQDFFDGGLRQRCEM